jgi:hypothetical protein
MQYETFSEWANLGYSVIKGEHSHKRGDRGVLFSREQVVLKPMIRLRRKRIALATIKLLYVQSKTKEPTFRAMCSRIKELYKRFKEY